MIKNVTSSSSPEMYSGDQITSRAGDSPDLDPGSFAWKVGALSNTPPLPNTKKVPADMSQRGANVILTLREGVCSTVYLPDRQHFSMAIVWRRQYASTGSFRAKVTSCILVLGTSSKAYRYKHTETQSYWHRNAQLSKEHETILASSNTFAAYVHGKSKLTMQPWHIGSLTQLCRFCTINNVQSGRNVQKAVLYPYSNSGDSVPRSLGGTCAFGSTSTA